MKEYDGDRDWVSNGVGGSGWRFFSLFFFKIFFSHIFQSVYVPSQNCISDQKSHTSTPLRNTLPSEVALVFKILKMKASMWQGGYI